MSPYAARSQRISAGLRDKPVTIQQLSASVGASNFPTESWSTLVSLEYMSRQDGYGNELYGTVAAQFSATMLTTWQMPYRADMDPDLVDVPRVRRLVYSGRVFDIQSASIMDGRIGIELTTLAKMD